MDIEDHYLTLHKQYELKPDKTWFPVSMDELSVIFDCTRRNTQFLVQKLKEHGYIDWKSGLGRGNTSQLVLLRDKEELILEKARRRAQQGRIREAFECLQASSSESLHTQFHSWLGDQFGMHKQRSDEDVLRFPFYRPVPDLDPLTVVRRTEAHMIRQLFDTLVEYDPQQQTLKPGLAHHWECDETKSRWTFYLRKGVTFHHGKRLTAEDVRFTFERIRNWSAGDFLAQSVLQVEMKSTYCVCFQLSEPNALFAHFIATERFSIIPNDLEQIAARHDFARLPVGTGPFQMTENNESILVLEANERYFNGRPFLDRIEMWVWPNYEEQLRSRERSSDQTQLLYFEALSKGDSDRTLNQYELGSTLLTFNLSKDGVVQDRRLREAIHLALDRKQMIRELQGKRAVTSSGFDPGWNDPAYGNGTDLDAAKELLRSSTYAGEVLQLYTYEYFSNEEDVRWIRQECGKLGVKVEINVLPILELSQAGVIVQADMIFVGEVLGGQPSIALIEMYRSPNGYIRNHLDAATLAKVDGRIREALETADPEQRMQILRRIEAELKRQCSVLFMYHSVQTVGHEKSLHGIEMNAWGKINYKEIWIE